MVASLYDLYQRGEITENWEGGFLISMNRRRIDEKPFTDNTKTKIEEMFGNY